ncbi:hypothetical protein F5X98DRAFT_381919 [Xylaria grammica]|nr:hypothetical protein F5X98DRAFT_381919 [Xylaria grammica]
MLATATQPGSLIGQSFLDKHLQLALQPPTVASNGRPRLVTTITLVNTKATGGAQKPLAFPFYEDLENPMPDIGLFLPTLAKADDSFVETLTLEEIPPRLGKRAGSAPQARKAKMNFTETADNAEIRRQVQKRVVTIATTLVELGKSKDSKNEVIPAVHELEARRNVCALFMDAD